MVRLSAESAVKRAAHHSELRISDYRLLPELIENGEFFRGRRGDHLLFFHKSGGRWYQAVVKQTRNNELFLTTFHYAQLRQLIALRKLDDPAAHGGARKQNPT